MKTIFALLLAMALTGHSQNIQRLGFSVGSPTKPEPLPSANPKIQDPWRIINGTTNYVLGTNQVFKLFFGKVLGTHPDGIRIDGAIFPTVERSSRYGESVRTEFFVRGFSRSFVDGEFIGPENGFAAIQSGHHQYNTALGGTRKIVSLDYGRPTDEPSWVKENQLKALDAEKKRQSQAAGKLIEKSIAYERGLMDKGEALGFYMIGCRYLKGDGLEKDETKALGLLKTAADKGSTDAASLLKQRPTPVPK